jgi:hypothetical protein
MAANTLLSFMIGSSLPGVASMFQRRVERTELRAMGAARLAVTSFSGAIGAAAASLWLSAHSTSPVFFTGAMIYLIAGFCLANHCRRITA